MVAGEAGRLATQLGHLMGQLKWRVATAESCTGGGLGEAITSVPGSSAWYAGGVVSYSNEAKQSLLGIEEELLEKHGAVSEAVTRSMALRVRELLDTEAGVAVSGIAGPDGGTPDKPVGTVWIAWSLQGVNTFAELCSFPGERDEVRAQTVRQALRGLLAVARHENR